MRTNAVIRIVVFSLVILILLGLLAAGLGLGLGIFTVHWKLGITSLTDAQQGSSGQIPASEIRNLNIEWVSGSITIQPGDTDQILFCESGKFSEDQQMIWHQSGDTLTIQFCRTQIFMGFQFNGSKDLVITVPRDYSLQSLDIDSVSARINVSDLTAEEMELDNVSGACTFENCNAREMSADTVSGQVTFTGTLDILTCSTTSADCLLKTTNSPKELSLNGVSGDLILELPEGCGFIADMDSISGSISSEFETSVSKNHHRHGDGGCRITADTVSGDIIIRKAS